MSFVQYKSISCLADCTVGNNNKDKKYIRSLADYANAHAHVDTPLHALSKAYSS